MDPVTFFVVAGTVATVTFSWANFLINARAKNEDDLDEAEQRILELMGRFKYVSGLRLEMLDKKIEEIKRVIREANEIYTTLTVKITDLMKLKEDFINVEEAIEEKNILLIEGNQDLQKRKVEHGIVKEAGKVSHSDNNNIEEVETSIEKKILALYDEGYTEVEIAKKLGIGVGEVQLMIGLFRRGR